MSTTAEVRTIQTNIPARLDRLPWSRFHWRIVIGLGTVWILDGLQVTIVGAIGPRLTEADSGIHLSSADIGIAAALYVAGACIGALLFGHLTDRYGRKKLFMITLALYIAASVATAFAFAPWYFFLFRTLTGLGIGGEYSAINTAIDELIPARNRGRVDLGINGSFWVGAGIGGLAALLFLDKGIFPADVGWRLAFGTGAILGFGIMLVRRHVPESPRWLFIHGREEEAERIVRQIEEDVAAETGQELSDPEDSIVVRQRDVIPFREIARVAIKYYPTRALLGLALFIGQAFLYNAVTFDLGTILSGFFGVSSSAVPYFMVIFAAGNFLGPLLLGRFFDTIGRIPMISGTYLVSAALVVVLGLLLRSGSLTRWSFEALLVGTFFFASAGASSAYLTVSEIFPMETRALAIALFYAVGTAIGGISGPLLFGHFIHSGSADQVATGFFIGAGAMALGGVAELLWGVRAEGRSLENIAKPLTAAEAEAALAGPQGADGGGEPEPEPSPAGSPVAAGSPGRVDALQHREDAEEQRAVAAEHRSELHLLRIRADHGDEQAAEQLAIEEIVIQIAELRAEGLEEQATALDERATAARAATEADRREALERADADEERARDYEQRVAVLSAEHGAAAEPAPPHPGMPSGPPRFSRETQGARDVLANAQRDLQDSQSARDAARAQASERRGAGDEDQAGRFDRQARDHDELVQAAEQRIDAAEHRVRADDLRAEQIAASRTARGPAAPPTRETGERAERIRRRAAERRVRDRRGLRRFRPGPGIAFYSPGMLGTAGTATRYAAIADIDLDREIDLVVRAVDERGALDRDELARIVGGRFWGPGRFRVALREAVGEGRAQHLSGETYGPRAEPSRTASPAAG